MFISYEYVARIGGLSRWGSVGVGVLFGSKSVERLRMRSWRRIGFFV